MRKNKILWVWHGDDVFWGDDVMVAPGEPRQRSWGYTHDDAVGVCYKFWVKATGVRLKKGAEPIRLRLTAELLDQEDR